MNSRKDGPNSSDLFDQALSLSRHLETNASNLMRVAGQTSPESARAAFQQWELRRKAASKFSRSEEMFFHREALEQSSGELCAAYHASRFPPDVLVTDLTVGIGGDLIQFARRGPTQGFETDSERLDLAVRNLEALGLNANLKLEDGLAWMEDSADEWVFVDPARRVAGRRTLDPRNFTPDPQRVSELGKRQKLCVTKLTPLLDDHFFSSVGSAIEFVSAGGECKEALVYTGEQAPQGISAVLAETEERLFTGGDPIRMDSPEDFFYDVDPAAIRAHCLGTLGKRFDLKALSDSNGYLTGMTLSSSSWLKPYRVLETGSGDLKKIRSALTSLSSSTPVLKQRATGLDLQQMWSSLKLNGERELTVAFYRSSQKIKHVILAPISD